MKKIKSTDPRKKLISDTFKALFHCVKITCIKEDDEKFYARCFKSSKERQGVPWEFAGEQWIWKDKLFSETK